MKMFIKRLLTVLSATAGVFAVIGLVLVFLGFRPFVINTSSMEPLFKKGSMCWVDTRANLSSLARGDVVAYRTEANVLVLHRVIEIVSFADDEVTVLLQGDANNTVQEISLNKVNYIGREVFTIPGLGSVVSAFSSASWFVYGLIASLIILACVPRLPRLHRIASHIHTGKKKEAAS